MKILKKILGEPQKIPEGDTRKVLVKYYGWDKHHMNKKYDTYAFTLAILGVELARLKRVIWEELTK